jgi:hypothetical protein
MQLRSAAQHMPQDAIPNISSLMTAEDEPLVMQHHCLSKIFQRSVDMHATHVLGAQPLRLISHQVLLNARLVATVATLVNLLGKRDVHRLLIHYLLMP